MKRFAFSKAVIATALIGACSSAFAADTAEIIVKGQVVPAACSIDITGSGVFDYGLMTKSQINTINGGNAETTQTRLGEKVQTFTIDCGATDTSIAWRAFDAWQSTATDEIPGFTIAGEAIYDPRKHGLGTVLVSNTPINIGQYGAVVDQASVKVTHGGQADLPGRMVASGTNGDAWWTGSGAPVINNSPWDLQSFRTVGASGPQPVAHVSGDIHVEAAVNRLDALPDAFSFHGLTTLTLVYLGTDNKPLP